MRSPAVGCIQPSPGVSGSCALKERMQRRQLPLSLADVNELSPCGASTALGRNSLQTRLRTRAVGDSAGGAGSRVAAAG